MIKIGGYRTSENKIEFPIFKATLNKFAKMGSSNNEEYIIPEYTAISDQGNISSCCGNATADALEILKGLEDPSKVVQVSRLFIYYNARAQEGAINQDSGCFIHDALNSLKTIGVCEESKWAYDVSKVFTHPPLEAYKEAADNKITEFYQITSSGNDKLNDIETAIRANHPCVFGTQVGADLQNYDGNPNTVFDYPQNPIGGHAIVVTGVRKNADGSRSFYIRNSWGSGFGLNGHMWFSDNYMANINTRDIFVPTRMIDFSL